MVGTIIIINARLNKNSLPLKLYLDKTYAVQQEKNSPSETIPTRFIRLLKNMFTIVFPLREYAIAL